MSIINGQNLAVISKELTLDMRRYQEDNIFSGY